MAELIWLDENGNEISRAKKGRGRPPKGAELRNDGNFYAVKGVNARFVHQYIVVDKDGKQLSAKDKGRGRPAPGFEKMTDGKYVGHWVKVVKVAQTV